MRTKAYEVIAESIYKYDHGTIKLIGIETELLEDDFDLSVNDKLEWVLLNELHKYQLAPADVPIGDRLVELYGNV